MLTQFENELKCIAGVFIHRVMNKLDDHPDTEPLYLEWAGKFANLEPADEAWEKLTHHIHWPI